MAHVIHNINAKLIFNDTGYTLMGLDSVSIEANVEKRQVFAKDGKGGPITEQSGLDIGDTMTFTTTHLLKQTHDIIKNIFDLQSDNPGSIESVSVVVSSKIDPSKQTTLIFAMPMKRVFQTIVDETGASKYTIMFSGKILESNNYTIDTEA